MERYIDEQDFENACNVIGLDLEKAELLVDIVKYIRLERFINLNNSSANYSKKMLDKKLITEEEYEQILLSEKKFCFNGDFDSIYSDFLRFYQIDLIDTDVDWFKFKWLFNSILNIEDSACVSVMSKRNYKYDKNMPQEYNDAKLQEYNRFTYGLPIQSTNRLEDVIKGGGK